MEPTNPIHEWLNTPIPKKLWHYTSIEGFYGITTTKQIYATDLRFLNDREEFTHARKLTEELIQESPETGPNGYGLREIVRQTIKYLFDPGIGPLRPDYLQFFVVSFSAAEDQLSQWRGYSRGSSGASLGFDLSRLRQHEFGLDLDRIRRSTGGDFPAFFAPCVYDQSKKKELIRFALHHGIEGLSSIYNELPQVKSLLETKSPTSDYLSVFNEIREKVKDPMRMKRLVDAVLRTFIDLFQIVALLKNPSFEEEREWRLLISGKQDEAPPYARQFRVGSTTLVPYVAYPFSTEPNAQVPLSDLILGPGSDEHAVSAAQSFLHTQGIEIEPRPSAVPFRPR